MSEKIVHEWPDCYMGEEREHPWTWRLVIRGLSMADFRYWLPLWFGLKGHLYRQYTDCWGRYEVQLQHGRGEDFRRPWGWDEHFDSYCHEFARLAEENTDFKERLEIYDKNYQELKEHDDFISNQNDDILTYAEELKKQLKETKKVTITLLKFIWAAEQQGMALSDSFQRVIKKAQKAAGVKESG